MNQRDISFLLGGLGLAGAITLGYGPATRWLTERKDKERQAKFDAMNKANAARLKAGLGSIAQPIDGLGSIAQPIDGFPFDGTGFATLDPAFDFNRAMAGLGEATATSAESLGVEEAEPVQSVDPSATPAGIDFLQRLA